MRRFGPCGPLRTSEEGAGGFVIVPCSHKSNVETPDDVLTGRDDMGLTLQPELKAGDLLLVAGALLTGHATLEGERSATSSVV